MKIKPVKLFMCVRVTTFGVLKQRSRFKKKVRKDLDFMTRVCVCVCHGTMRVCLVHGKGVRDL